MTSENKIDFDKMYREKLDIARRNLGLPTMAEVFEKIYQEKLVDARRALGLDSNSDQEKTGQ